MPNWLETLIVILSIILFVLALIYIVGGITFNLIFKRRKNDKHFSELESEEDKSVPDRIWFAKLNIIEYEVKSKDKLSLKGYFLNNNSDKLAIILHGYKGRYYSSVTQARIFYENGYDVFLPNNRAHDSSEGLYFSMGKKERDDFHRFINLMINKNPNYQIVIMGVSMGAHIALVSSKQYPSNVKCLIEDCGYASLKDTLIEQTSSFMIKPLAKLLIALAEIFAITFCHFNFRSDVKKELKNNKLPILLIHGDKDERVLYENMHIIASSLDKNVDYKEVTFKDAKHNEAHLEKDKYKEVITDFVNKIIV